jgi:hypothetical protein
LARWHAERAIGEIRVGGQLRLAWDSLGVGIDLQIAEAEPRRRLLLRGAPSGRATQELEIRILPEEDQSRILVTHSGFISSDEAEGSLSGWEGALALLSLYLERYDGRPRRCAAALASTVASFSEVFARFTEPGRLAGWLGSSPTRVGPVGSAVAIHMHDHAELRGSVISRTDREITLAVPDLEGAIAWRCLALDSSESGSKIVGAFMSSWANDVSLLQAWQTRCAAAVERLGGLLGGRTARA